MSVHWEPFHEDRTPLSEAPEVFLKISKYSQENTCVRMSPPTQVFSSE